jgi:hypothetical protein
VGAKKSGGKAGGMAARCAASRSQGVPISAADASVSLAAVELAPVRSIETATVQWQLSTPWKQQSIAEKDVSAESEMQHFTGTGQSIAASNKGARVPLLVFRDLKCLNMASLTCSPRVESPPKRERSTDPKASICCAASRRTSHAAGGSVRAPGIAAWVRTGSRF